MVLDMVLDRVRVFNKHVLNPAMKLVAGQHYRYAGVIEHTGRRSGKTYSTPVVVERVGDGASSPASGSRTSSSSSANPSRPTASDRLGLGRPRRVGMGNRWATGHSLAPIGCAVAQSAAAGTCRFAAPGTGYPRERPGHPWPDGGQRHEGER